METEAKILTLLSLDRSKRRWRLVAIFALAAAFLFAASLTDQSKTLSKNHIARIEVSGFISNDTFRLKQLEDLADDKFTKAVLVYVDSPGGTMVGGMNLLRAIKRLGEKKPVVVAMGDVAASAGYMVALGGEYIVASEGTMTASVGVFMPLVDATRLAEKVGIDSIPVSSGEMKLATYPLATPSASSKAYLESLAKDLGNVFLDVVAKNRKVSKQVLKTISDGRVVVGINAKEMGLVDAVGDEKTALDWLYTQKGIASSLPVEDVATEEDETWLKRTLVEGRIFSPLVENALFSKGALAIQ